ncbi:cytochrome c-type biogenesis protein [Thalassotalea ganghwensis]
MKHFLLLCALVLSVSSLSAFATDVYQFEDKVTQKRYNTLIKELRCPKCQNQNLADSNSPIAADLRREVYEMLMQNKSDGEIVNFMVKRYGEFVLYRPKVSNLTYILWFGPAILLLLGAMVVVFVLRTSAKKKNKTLSPQQQQKLEDILKDK